MRLRDLNWMDVEEYLETDNRIILPVGATEQHGYLSVMTDALIPEKIADVVGEREKVLVAPALNFGVSTMFEAFPGTISLSQTTFAAILDEIIQSLRHQGFTRFLIINGNEGNVLPRSLQDMKMEGLVQIQWYDWWCGTAMTAFEEQHQLRVEHANWSENFAFNRVAQLPEGTKDPVNLALIEEGLSVREVLGDGCYGGLYQLNERKMFQLFDRVADEAIDLLQSLRE